MSPTARHAAILGTTPAQLEADGRSRLASAVAELATGPVFTRCHECNAMTVHHLDEDGLRWVCEHERGTVEMADGWELGGEG